MVQIAIAVEDFVSPSSRRGAEESGEQGTFPLSSPTLQREIALLDPIAVNDRTAVTIVVRSNFFRRRRAVAALVEIRPGRSPDHQRRRACLRICAFVTACRAPRPGDRDASESGVTVERRGRSLIGHKRRRAGAGVSLRTKRGLACARRFRLTWPRDATLHEAFWGRS